MLPEIQSLDNGAMSGPPESLDPINNVAREMADVKRGIPQGSDLGGV